MRGSAVGQAADRLVGDGGFSERVRCQAEARRRRLVCECLDRGRGAGGGGRWCGRDRRAGDGGPRTSGMLRCLAGRTPARRIVRVDTGGGGRGRGGGGRGRRGRGGAWRGRGGGGRGAGRGRGACRPVLARCPRTTQRGSSAA